MIEGGVHSIVQGGDNYEKRSILFACRKMCQNSNDMSYWKERGSQHTSRPRGLINDKMGANYLQES
jgi:hypothetical protein